ncbi:MAG: SDR family oxidoreductase [Actinobacteria bacterium]|nr:SDR family oxidoreductase [Actinomycetota bacterium]
MLKNKTVVVTGASSGIGKGIALLFAQNNARVAMVARREEKLQQIVEENKDLEILPVKCDVSDFNQVKISFDKIIKKFGNIDILINNAGTIGKTEKPFENIGLDDWEYLWRVNISSIFYWARLIMPVMYKQKSGNIINISSVAASKVHKYITSYCATKIAIINLTKGMALEAAEYGVRINCISPGVVESEFLAQKLKGVKKGIDMQKSFAYLHPIGRIGTPDDIAQAALFLVSDKASWIIGTNIIVDGGYAIYNHL